MKFIGHLVVYAVMFIAGLGVGIYYDNQHPGAGSNIANAERRAVLKGEITVYKKIVQDREANPADNTPDGQAKTKDYQDLQDEAQAELDSLPAPAAGN